MPLYVSIYIFPRYSTCLDADADINIQKFAGKDLQNLIGSSALAIVCLWMRDRIGKLAYNLTEVRAWLTRFKQVECLWMKRVSFAILTFTEHVRYTRALFGP